MYDSYLKEFSAKVVDIKENAIVLDQTAFYPWGGGLDSDIGIIIKGDREYNVLEVKKDKETGDILHYLNDVKGLNIGDNVVGRIDWDRRYKLMRLHTAAHIIAAILYNKYNVLITGGHITPEYARDDFSIDKDNWREIINETIEEANNIVREAREVKVYFLPREEAMKIPGIIKLASKLPPIVKELRIVEIEGIDIQADGGPHVKNTREVGKIRLLKAENRGKNKKRIYYTVD